MNKKNIQNKLNYNIKNKSNYNIQNKSNYNIKNKSNYIDLIKKEAIKFLIYGSIATALSAFSFYKLGYYKALNSKSSKYKYIIQDQNGTEYLINLKSKKMKQYPFKNYSLKTEKIQKNTRIQTLEDIFK